jgi:hypothetical protein
MDMKAQWMRLNLCLMILMNGLVLYAEPSDKEKKTDVLMIQSETPPTWESGVEMPLPPGDIPVIPGTFAFVSAEMETGGKVIKGAPYSAQAVTERVQNLADGNRIVHQSTASIYRDGEGRTRREQQFGALGLWVAEKDAPQTIFIHDPVAGTSYILDPKNQIAHKLLSREPRLKMAHRSQDHMFEIKAPGFGMIHELKGVNRNDADQKPESLGKQVIEGVEAEGTRTTITVPEGEIGNERPIQIISEKWYSPELQIHVLTKDSDPRFGETTYRVINISRQEPDASLFQVPSGFKLEQ